MTRRGTLVYYLAAWVIGCFIVTVVGWTIDLLAGESAVSTPFLNSYFISLIAGSVDSLLFALLLRLVTRRFPAPFHLVIWVLAGASLAVPLTLLLAWAGQAWLALEISRVFSFVFPLVFLAPMLLRRTGLAYLVIEGAATAAVLCLINRAFNRPAEASTATPAQT